jgi:hypothetical protein
MDDKNKYNALDFGKYIFMMIENGSLHRSRNELIKKIISEMQLIA